MAIKDALLGEYDHEMQTTRALVAVVPDTDADWKPHPKSMSLKALATHVVNIINWGAAVLATEEIDVAGKFPFEPAKFEDGLLKQFDAIVAKTRAAIDAASDEQLRVRWTLKNGGKPMFTLPRIGALRSFVMNHHIHHRGQLSVYLRLRDVPLPGIYGPSADS